MTLSKISEPIVRQAWRLQYYASIPEWSKYSQKFMRCQRISIKNVYVHNTWSAFYPAFLPKNAWKYVMPLPRSSRSQNVNFISSLKQEQRQTIFTQQTSMHDIFSVAMIVKYKSAERQFLTGRYLHPHLPSFASWRSDHRPKDIADFKLSAHDTTPQRMHLSPQHCGTVTEN